MIQHFDARTGASPLYSTSVRLGDLIVTSGQLGAELNGPESPFPEQARIALRRMVEAVELAGGSRDTIVGVRAYLHSLDDFPEWNVAYHQVMGTGGPMPSRTTVQVAGFLPPLLVEVEALAGVATGS